MHSVANRIISIQKPRHVSTAQQSTLARSKRKKFLCKNRLKIWCSNYIKNFVEMYCFFNAYKRLSLKSYAKESSLYGAISRVLYFRNSPGQSSQFTQFLLLSESVWSEIACKKYAPTHSVISIDIFLKCGIMYYRSECEKEAKYDYRMYKKAS